MAEELPTPMEVDASTPAKGGSKGRKAKDTKKGSAGPTDNLPLASAANLPPAVENRRTRVNIHPHTLSNSATVMSASAYYSLGVSNRFDMEDFKRNFRIEIKKLTPDEIIFDMIGVDAPIANAFRRILLAEIPTMAIEKVFVSNNTSMLKDEVLAHRLGLIPIKANPAWFDYCPSDEAFNDRNVIQFMLNIKCTRKPSAKGQKKKAAAPSTSGSSYGIEGLKDATSDEDLENAKVFSRSFTWNPIGAQAELASDPPRPVLDDILIAKLRPGQAIDVTCLAMKGIGKDHAKFSPVCTASYRLLPEVVIDNDITGAAADELKAKCPVGVFDIEDLGGGTRRAVVADSRRCTMCRECIREPQWEKKVKLRRVKNHYIFTVESTGILAPEVLVEEATKILVDKCKEVAKDLQDYLPNRVV